MYFSIREITIVRLLVPFIIGVVIGDNIQCSEYIIRICLIAVLIYVSSSFIKPSVRLIVQNLMICNLFLLAGIFTVNSRGQPPKISNAYLDNPVYSTIVLRDFPKTRNSHIIRGEVFAIDESVLSKPLSLEIYSQDSTFAALRPLDTILVQTTIKSIPAPSDPYAFNYGRYLSHKRIYYQAWAGSVITRQGVMEYTGLASIRYGLRYDIIQTIKDRFSAEAASILSALLVGFRYDIDADLQKQFANSGAIHVLAVSGLHVGIVVGLLKLIFLRLPRRPWVSAVESITLVVGLTLYALLTGLSVPVIRASSIVILILLSRKLPFHVNSFNALAAVAFLIAVIDPYQIYQLGYQMSFAAVAGILLYYQRIHKLLYFKNCVLRYIWSLCAVSLSAQVFIIPLSLYYFHQFPTYFLFSSIVAIGCAATVIVVGIPLLLLGYVNEIFLEGLVVLNIPAYLMVHSTAFFDQLYGSVLKVIWHEPQHVALLFMAIISLTIYIRIRQITWLHLCLGSLMSFGLMCTYNLSKQKQQVAFSSYEADERIVDIIIGETVYELGGLTHSANKKLFITQNFRHAKGVKKVMSAEDLRYHIKALNYDDQ